MAETCQFDGQDEAWHRGNNIHHSFSPSGELHKQVPPKNKPKVGDPALRMVLVQKGLITPEELEAVEKQLTSLGMAVSDPSKS